MRILLDTSAYAAFMRSHTAILKVVQEADEIHLNAIVLGELRSGFLKGKYREKNEKELTRFLSSPRVNTLSLDDETADRYAVILISLWKAGTSIPTNDIWISATCMQYGLRLVTTDTHFQKVSQILVQHFDLNQ